MAIFIGVVCFVAAVYVQDLLRGDLRPPVLCMGREVRVAACVTPRINLWLAAAVAAIGAGVTYWLLGRLGERGAKASGRGAGSDDQAHRPIDQDRIERPPSDEDS